MECVRASSISDLDCNIIYDLIRTRYTGNQNIQVIKNDNGEFTIAIGKSAFTFHKNDCLLVSQNDNRIEIVDHDVFRENFNVELSASTGLCVFKSTPGTHYLEKTVLLSDGKLPGSKKEDKNVLSNNCVFNTHNVEFYVDQMRIEGFADTDKPAFGVVNNGKSLLVNLIVHDNDQFKELLNGDLFRIVYRHSKYDLVVQGHFDHTHPKLIDDFVVTTAGIPSLMLKFPVKGEVQIRIMEA